LIWALEKRGYENVRKLRRWPVKALRKAVPNPWDNHESWCAFCLGVRRLTSDERHDSALVGSLPRCREHLKEIEPGLALAA
jgi:hypothetical protein